MLWEMNESKKFSISITCSEMASLKCRQEGDENVNYENICEKWISDKRHSKEAE